MKRTRKDLDDIYDVLYDINLSLKVISHRMTVKEANEEWCESPFC